VSVIAQAAGGQRAQIERVTAAVGELTQAMQGEGAANAEQSAAAADEPAWGAAADLERFLFFS